MRRRTRNNRHAFTCASGICTKIADLLIGFIHGKQNISVLYGFIKAGQHGSRGVAIGGQTGAMSGGRQTIGLIKTKY